MQSPTKNAGQGFGSDASKSVGEGSVQTSGSAGGTRNQLKSDAKQLSTTASNRLHTELDARKGTAATQARSVSSAIGQAAEGLDDGAPQWLHSAFQQGAQKAQMFAESLEQKDSRQILGDIQDMARNNPGTFIAACAALGFAAARIFRAGAPDSAAPPSTPTQLPPVQGEEPMFRSSGAGASASPSSAGEFV